VNEIVHLFSIHITHYISQTKDSICQTKAEIQYLNKEELNSVYLSYSFYFHIYLVILIENFNLFSSSTLLGVNFLQVLLVRHLTVTVI